MECGSALAWPWVCFLVPHKNRKQSFCAWLMSLNKAPSSQSHQTAEDLSMEYVPFIYFTVHPLLGTWVDLYLSGCNTRVQ